MCIRAGCGQRHTGFVKPTGPFSGIAAPGFVICMGEPAKQSAAQQSLKVERPVEVRLAYLADQPNEAADGAVAMENMGVIHRAAGLNERCE